MRVAVLCEFSGVVRDAFRREGHEAVSCDLMPTERPGPHVQGDWREYDWSGFDLVIAHPPCTHLTKAGAHLWKKPGRERAQVLAVEFVKAVAALPVPRIAIENPPGALSRLWRPSDQIIHPHQFGHAYRKETCLWLKNLPHLEPTARVSAARLEFILNVPERKSRAADRSRTFEGIARAMARQWGALPRM